MNNRPTETVRAPRSDEVISRLEAEIVDGTLVPGQKVSEMEIALRFGTGRAPVREAFRTLESRRLLQRVPFAGMRVVQLERRDVIELLTIRETLEGLAARQAAESINHNGRRRLALAVEGEGELARGGVGAVFHAGSRENGFHETVVSLSGNEWLAAMLMGDLYTLLRTVRFRSASDHARRDAAHEEHDAIADAIRQSRPDKAEKLMRAHIRHSLTHLLAQDW